MPDLTQEEILCRDELVQAGLDPELATTIARKQVALRKEKEAQGQTPPASKKKQVTKPAQSVPKPQKGLELDYRNEEVPKWVKEAIETSLAIDTEDARSAGSIGYMARAMVIATLPYRNPKNPDGTPKVDYVRRNGNFTLRIVAGYEGGIPYGVHPRMLLSWIASEAVRRQSPVIELGDSLRTFLREVLDVKSTSGGKRSSATLVMEQIKRLFGSMVTAVYSGEKDGSFALRNVLIANQLKLSEREMTALLTAEDSALEKVKSDILDSIGEPVKKDTQSTDLWVPQSAREAGKWNSFVELSRPFFEECIQSPVPIDLRAYRALKDSPMAMDAYAWLTYRMSYLKTRSRPIPWEALFLQFGTGIKQNAEDPMAAVRDFKKAFLRALKVVSILYPDAKFENTKSGLVLIPSPTHIPRIGWNSGTGNQDGAGGLGPGGKGTGKQSSLF